MIVTIRTDQPQAEVGLYADDGMQAGYHTWWAHRELSATLLDVIRIELEKHAKTFADIAGIIVFKGPGSFTGLRIGITVADSLAYGLNVPIVGGEGEQWIAAGLQKLHNKVDEKLILPHYGAEANITQPKR